MEVRSPIGKSSSKLPIVLIALMLIVITMGVYSQVRHHGFLNLDDNVYVTDNSHVTTGLTAESILWAFGADNAAGFWHPITWLSHMADVQLYGMNPRGHHLTNVVIHTICAVLLLLLLFRATGSIWQSSFVAALFAFHPLRVESVAWVAERKDVLSAFFWLLTLLLYTDYVKKRTPALYILALSSFVLGLMSKPMLVTLPIVMLLMDFWPLERYRHEESGQDLHYLAGKAVFLIKEKIPFFACSVLLAIVTIYAQHRVGATQSLDEIPLLSRIENALVAYVKYIGITLWPNDLAPLYPMILPIPFWQVIGSMCLLLLLSVAAIRAGQRYSYLPVGWFWFLVTLLPAIGLIQVGTQSMADRFVYIPGIGLSIIVAWGVPELTKGLKYREIVLSVLAGAVLMASVALTWIQLGYWSDNISLYRRTLQVTTGNYIIHNNLGSALANRWELDAAILEFREALRIYPDYADAHYNLGMALATRGELDAAIRELREALRINPMNGKASRNLGLVLEQKQWLMQGR